MRSKVAPQRQSRYACQESLDWIRSYTLSYFKDHEIQCDQLWMIDDNQEIFNNQLRDQGVVDIVLTGSFFLRLLELPFWPIENFRIWTFSHDLRETISLLFKIDKNLIGLIPHPKNNNSEVNNQAFRHFVYAGRLSWGKNIEALLALTSFLQHSSFPQLQLTLFGQNNQNPEESLGRMSGEDFDINKLLQQFKWVSPPNLMGYQPQWNQDLSKFSHYISLSTSMYEDFAVSPSQALEQLPAFLSNWGGHKHKEGAKLLSSHLIFNGHDPLWIKEEKTKLLAEHLLNDELALGSSINFHPAQALKKVELTSFSLDFIKQQSPEILLCFREALDAYADTTKGRDVFYRYRKQFGTPYQSSKVYIYNNDQVGSPIFDKEETLIHEWDLYLPSVQRLLIKAEKISISKSAHQAIKHLEDKLGLTDILHKL